MKIGVDASNLLLGGGLTHLIEILLEAMPKEKAIDKVIVWGKQETLNVPGDRLWLEKICPSEIDHGWLSRIYWQRFKLPKQADITGCDILFVPGGNHSDNFRPVVTISQNLHRGRNDNCD